MKLVSLASEAEFDPKKGGKVERSCELIVVQSNEKKVEGGKKFVGALFCILQFEVGKLRQQHQETFSSGCMSFDIHPCRISESYSDRIGSLIFMFQVRQQKKYHFSLNHSFLAHKQLCPMGLPDLMIIVYST